MVFEKVRDIIASTLKLDPSKVTLEASLEHDLGADSLDAVEVIMALEEEFDLQIPDNSFILLIMESINCWEFLWDKRKIHEGFLVD